LKRLAGLLALLWFSSADAKTLHYLYIEANEGTASGGHVALQLEDTVFHYQYSDGLIRLAKDDGADFDFDYRYLQNRNLRVADIEVSDDSFAVLQDYFNRQFWDQDRQFKHFQALENDIHLLTWLLSLKTASPTLPRPALQLPAAGLFFAASDFDDTQAESGPCQTQAAADSVMGVLRRRVEQKHGADYLAQRLASQTQSILDMVPSSSDNVADFNYTFSQRYLDMLNGLLAMRALRESRPLSASACHALTEDGRLDAGQVAALRHYQQQLLQSAQNLFASKRPDWGQALFVALARLVAVEQSLASGQWFFLDDFAPEATVIATARYANQAAAMQQHFLAAQNRWRQQRQALTAAQTLDDLGYADLELAANRYHEWQASQSHTLRFQGQQALPLKPLALPNWVLPQLSALQLQQSLAALQSRLPDIREHLHRHYDYDLFSRNCVTELFRHIDLALGAKTEPRLSSRLNPAWQIIPFTAFADLRQQYPDSQTRLLPSLRRQQLAKQYAEEFAPWVFARESNVLTAELYRYNPDDAAFLFFTDDSLLPRPLFGAFNLLTGLGQSLWGLAQLPVDAGAALHNGTRGILMSLPELVFVNIRKGSYKFVLPEQWPPAVALP
jgi:hypothetical protein